MIKILNQNRQYVAYLENAFNIGYEKTFNQIWGASFSLPLNDPKNEECKALYYVEVYDNEEYIGLFRIVPKRTVKNESTEMVTYQCEHVLATLLDSSLFQYHETYNITTRENLQYLIDQQKQKHWKLGTVDFTRYFGYKWENENLLSALFSVPKPFDVQYQWTWDTKSYPWTLNLVAPETAVTCEIREKKNLIGLELEENPMGVFNRIYPLGYGEGINQLNIAAVNNGVPYVEDAESIAEYGGVKEYIWVDKRFEDAQTLKASAEALLREWREPIVSWRISAADLSSITGEDIDKLRMGRIVRLSLKEYSTTDLRIMKESKSDIKGDPGNVQLEVGNLNADLGTTQADLQRRQQINELYAQGATNISNFAYNDNADQDNPAEIEIYLPDEMVKVNKLFLSFKTDKFRAYERAIGGGGSIVKSTSSGGGTTATSSSGGGSQQTSSSGGGVAKSTAAGGGTTVSSSISNPTFFAYTSTPVGINPELTSHIHAIEVTDQMNHSHNVTIQAHSHEFDIPNHSHTVTIPNHTHTVTIPAHTHDITLPDHTHEIQFGIFKLNNTPSKVTITVDGNTVPYTATNGDKINLIPYLSKDSEGKVNRGWHKVTITTNDLGRINAQIYTQFFIQSRGGGNF
ncbi:phage tail spike protein [Cytobacillus firmus]|uniref:phage tail spike protein n=1 Tax=Cytobacillus firmus TaxID=1399 RepID=UPI001CFECEBC|nr:phage tail spike protein [Cytobacillus firmus]